MLLAIWRETLTNMFLLILVPTLCSTTPRDDMTDKAYGCAYSHWLRLRLHWISNHLRDLGAASRTTEATISIKEKREMEK